MGHRIVCKHGLFASATVKEGTGCRQLERTLSPLLEDLDSHDDGQPSNGNDTVIELPLPVGVHAASLLAARMSQLVS